MPASEHFGESQFPEKSDEALVKFGNSFAFDRRLFEADIRSNLAYCDALFRAGILTRLEAEKVKNGLLTLLKRAKYNRNFFDECEAKDVHGFIEEKLVHLVGETAKKLCAVRSRSEQIATTFRLWLREEIEVISELTRRMQKALIKWAELNGNAVLLDCRFDKPIPWVYWCLAYFEMLKRDRERLEEVWRRTNVLPLGSGILAQTDYEIDQETIAKELGFEGVKSNDLDAASDRDFVIEFVSACSLLMVHLLRFAEDLVLYSSQEFRFIEFSNFSALNLKRKSHDALELIRSKSGRIFGYQVALLTTLRASPLDCSDDFREDKEIVFETVDAVEACLQVATLLIKNARLNRDRISKATLQEHLSSPEFKSSAVDQSSKEAQIVGVKTGKVLENLEKAKEELQFEEDMLNKYKIGFDRTFT